MNVSTYFTPLSEPQFGLTPEGEQDLIALWKTSWAKQGWTPVVIGEQQARAHPKFEKFNAAVYRFPTVNPREYTRATFLRWLAMAQLGGGLMVDYDVMNYGLRPEMVPAPRRLQILERHVPCVVNGTADEYLRICALFHGFKPNGEAEVGDMIILAQNTHAFNQWHVCREHGRAGWEKAPLVHFATITVPRPKAEPIRKLRPV